MPLDELRYYTAWHDHHNRKRYEAPADPWEPVHVDPSGVERWRTINLIWGLGRVRGGDWDRDGLESLRETATHDGLHERFVDGLDWEETVYYDRAERAIAEDGEYRGYEDIAEFREKRCAGLDDLYEEMKTDGYRPNYDHVYDDPEDIEFVHEMEPLVGIGRDGEVIWSEGYHRLVLAQILDIDAIPVYVIRRHEQWQQLRDSVARGDGIPPDRDVDPDHPDLQDVQ